MILSSTTISYVPSGGGYDIARFSYNPYFLASFFSQNNIFLSQQISRNSILIYFFSETNMA